MLETVMPVPPLEVPVVPPLVGGVVPPSASASASA
ncbi:hypothetical protein NT05LM_2115, partial [Listeria marthii FSL S4-120]